MQCLGWFSEQCFILPGHEFYKGAMRLSEELDSDIIHAGLGPHPVIFLNSLQAIEDAMTGNELLDRVEGPFTIRKNIGKNLGHYKHGGSSLIGAL